MPTIRCWVDDDDPFDCALSEFLAVNADDQEACDAARNLTVGQSFVGGGGAACEYTIRRVR